VFHENLTSLLFGLRKLSGGVAPYAVDWLSNRRALFQADSAVGTVHENGLLDKDEIDMYPFNVPRKRLESLLEDSLATVKKKARHG